MYKIKTAIRLTELGGLVDTIIRDYTADEKVQVDPFVKSVVSDIDTKNSVFTIAILQDKTLSNLEAADAARDEALKTLGALLNAYAIFPIESKKTLAVPLKAIYEKYVKAGILSANYTSESKMIESMLLDFAADNLSENIKGLEGVGEAINAIRSAQNIFTSRNDAYIAACTNRSAPASSYKKPLLSLVNDKLVPYLEAMLIAKNETCSDFARQVEKEINRMNDTVAKRKGKKNDTGDGEDEKQAESSEAQDGEQETR